MVRTALTATIIALVAAVLLASGVASTRATHRVQRLSGGSFTSTIDARWTVLARAGAPGFRTLALSSTGAQLDREGIPPAGAIGITIRESPASAIARRSPEAPTRLSREPPPTRSGARAAAAIALLAEVVRTPASAQGVAVTGPPRFRTLAGASAAEATYEYVYRGRGNVQVDVVARRAGRVYFVEVDTELAHIAQGESAFAQLLRDWHWH